MVQIHFLNKNNKDWISRTLANAQPSLRPITSCFYLTPLPLSPQSGLHMCVTPYIVLFGVYIKSYFSIIYLGSPWLNKGFGVPSILKLLRLTLMWPLQKGGFSCK